MEAIFVPENRIGTEREVTSPSGKYLLRIGTYKTKPGCWNYTKGTVFRHATNEVIAEICHNYGSFPYTFVESNGIEWFISGKTYTSQCFVNLATGEILDNSASKTSNDFIWAETKMSPDGRTLAVSGCVWGGSYELAFFDFTNLPNCLELKIVFEDDTSPDDIDPQFDDNEFIWQEDGTLMYHHRGTFYPSVGKYEYDPDFEYPFDESDPETEIHERYRVSYERRGDTVYAKKVAFPTQQ